MPLVIAMLEADLFDTAYGAFEGVFDERQRCEAIVERAIQYVGKSYGERTALALTLLEVVLEEIRTGASL